MSQGALRQEGYAIVCSDSRTETSTIRIQPFLYEDIACGTGSSSLMQIDPE